MNGSSARVSLIVGSLRRGLLWHGAAGAADWFPYKAEATEPAFRRRRQEGRRSTTRRSPRRRRSGTSACPSRT